MLHLTDSRGGIMTSKLPAGRGGGMIAVVSILYAAISSLIDVFSLEHGEHSILASDATEPEEREGVE